MDGIPETQDPFSQLSPQLSEVRLSVLSLIESGHPTLNKVTRYYFQLPSKQIRPLIVFLFSRATNGLGQEWDVKLREATCTDIGCGKESLDNPLSHPDVLNDWNPCMPEFTASFTLESSKRLHKSHCLTVPLYQPTAATEPTLFSPTYILPTQMRLAEIVEMIHTASLLHDDVIDVSSLRRGVPSAPAIFGNKLTVLGGNFVLGRATAALARLGDIESTGLITCVLSNLVEGEFLQLNDVEVGEGVETNEEQQRLRKDAWLGYLQKTYMKTGSLIAKSAKAAVILGGCQEGIWPEIAYAYGRNLGIAFQLIDDILDYETASATLGKPSGADLQLGLATAPALYAWEEHPKMGELIQRKFRETGDVELARNYVTRSTALQRSRVLAQRYADKAMEILAQLPDSEAKIALEMLATIVIGRKN